MAIRRHSGTPAPAVHKITGARRSLTEDVRSRQVRYVVSMSVRTACFLLAIATTGWWRAVFFAGAVVLPYVSVVIANAGREQVEPVAAVPPPARPALGPAPTRPPEI